MIAQYSISLLFKELAARSYEFMNSSGYERYDNFFNIRKFIPIFNNKINKLKECEDSEENVLSALN